MDKLREGFWGRLPLATIVGVIVALEMSAVLLKGFLRPDNTVPAAASEIGTTKALGIEIFTNYILAFEVAAVILLLAMVAAVALTLRRRKDSKYFDPAAAVKVKRADRIRIVSMKAESERANAKSETQTNAENTGA
jgi:NADH-quinone oxidoreductase subunit J